MKTLNLKFTIITIISFVSITNFCSAQQGSVSINQDKKIVALLDLRKEMNMNIRDSDRYKIQIYSGNRATAEKYRTDFNSKFDKWSSEIEFETPNYKIWIGNFRTKIEADKAFKEIKQKFPNALLLKPKR